MANKFLDNNGLLYLMTKLASIYVAKEAGKGLSENDFTTALKNKLDGIAEGANNYTLPQATAELLGGVKVGAGLEITPEGVLNATQGGKADSVDWSGVQSKPTTIKGYGITDAYTKTEIDQFLEGLDMAWDSITGKPSTFPPAEHNHDTLYYQKTEVYNKSEVDGKIASVYKAAGSIAFASLPEPSASNVGFVYNVTDAFTTNDKFVEGAGKQYPIGTNVGVVAVEGDGTTYMFDTFAGFVDLSDYMLKTDMVAISNQEIDEMLTP